MATEPAKKDAAPAKGKKATVCTKVYLTPDGEKSNATVDATALEFRFSNGVKRSVKLADFPEAVRGAATFHGISQKLGDSYAGAGGDPAAAVEKFDNVLEFLRGGDWVSRREGEGPTPTMLAEAVEAALVAKGEKVDEARRARIREKLKDKKEREGAMANELIAAQYKTIKARKAAEAAKEAQAKAKAATGTSLAGF